MSNNRILSRARFLLAGTVLGASACAGGVKSLLPNGNSSRSDASQLHSLLPQVAPTPINFGNEISVTDDGNGHTSLVYNGKTLLSASYAAGVLTAVGFGSSQTIVLPTPTPAPGPTPPAPTPSPSPSPPVHRGPRPFMQQLNEHQAQFMGYSRDGKSVFYQVGSTKMVATSAKDQGITFSTYDPSGYNPVIHVTPQLGISVSIKNLPGGKPLFIDMAKAHFATVGRHAAQKIDLSKLNSVGVLSRPGSGCPPGKPNSVISCDYASGPPNPPVSFPPLTPPQTPPPTGGGGWPVPTPRPTPNYYLCAFNIVEAIHSLGGITLSGACIYWVVGGIVASLAVPGVDVVTVLALIAAAIVCLMLAAAAAASGYSFSLAAKEAAANCK